MTHEQFITFETAKLAKQAGFDWECNERYNKKYDTNDSVPLHLSTGDNWNQYVGVYSAPTQSVLQRWLREERGMYIEITHTATDEFYVTIHSKCFMLHRRLLKDGRETLTFPTYEEALETGLQKALEQVIKIQKS